MGIFDRLFGKRKEEPPPARPSPQPPPPPPAPVRPGPPPVMDRKPEVAAPLPSGFSAPSVAPPPARTEAQPLPQTQVLTSVAEASPPPVERAEPPASATLLDPGLLAKFKETSALDSSSEHQPMPAVTAAFPSPAAAPEPPPQAQEDHFFDGFENLTEEERELLLELKREEEEAARRAAGAAPGAEELPAAAESEPEPEPSSEPVRGSFTTDLDRALVSLLTDEPSADERPGPITLDLGAPPEFEASPAADLETTSEPAAGEAEGAFAALGDEAGGDDFFDDEFGEFDEAFDTLVKGGESAQDGDEEFHEPSVSYDQTEIKKLFAEIASHYIKPVKNFIFELRAGIARKEWLEICQPAMLSLGKSANGMGLSDVSEGIGRFDALLVEARASFDAHVGGDLRDRILLLYEELTNLLPQTFTLGEESVQSEGMIINSLLKQIPDVGKVTIDKLYRAGLTNLESYFMGTKEDIAVASGLPIWLAERICEKFKQYQHDLETKPVEAGNSVQRHKLEQLTGDLQEFHEKYEQATAAEWSNPAAAEDRKFYRQARQDTQLQINIVLAELQAVDLVREIQRLSFEKRILRLQEFIAVLAEEAQE